MAAVKADDAEIDSAVLLRMTIWLELMTFAAKAIYSSLNWCSKCQQP
jgi:hypothetical protein